MAFIKNGDIIPIMNIIKSDDIDEDTTKKSYEKVVKSVKDNKIKNNPVVEKDIK